MDTDGVSITFVLRKELADQLPADSAELQAFLTHAVTQELKGVTASSMGKKGGAVKSPAKAASSRENGRKGGRPKRDDKT